MADDNGAGSNRRVGAGAVVLALLVVALLAFVFQNTEDARFNWLMIEITLPLWLALVVAAAFGRGHRQPRRLARPTPTERLTQQGSFETPAARRR